jgi:hypothetical protein
LLAINSPPQVEEDKRWGICSLSWLSSFFGCQLARPSEKVYKIILIKPLLFPSLG